MYIQWWTKVPLSFQFPLQTQNRPSISTDDCTINSGSIPIRILHIDKQKQWIGYVFFFFFLSFFFFFFSYHACDLDHQQSMSLREVLRGRKKSK